MSPLLKFCKHRSPALSFFLLKQMKKENCNQQNGAGGICGSAALGQTKSKVHFNHQHIKSSYLTHVAEIKGRYRSAFSTMSSTTVLTPMANIRTNDFKTL